MRKYVPACLMLGLTVLPSSVLANVSSQTQAVVHHRGGLSGDHETVEKSVRLQLAELNGRIYVNGKANQITVCVPPSASLHLTFHNQSSDVIHLVEVKRQHKQQKPVQIKTLPEAASVHGEHFEIKPNHQQSFMIQNLDLGRYTLVLQGDDGQTDKYLLHISVSPATSHVVFL